MSGNRWLVATVAAALLSVSLAAGDCTCFGTNQTINPTVSPMLIVSNPTDTGTTSGKACSAACSYLAYSGDDNKGLAIQFVANSLTTGTIKVYEGDDLVYTISKNTQLGNLSDYTSSSTAHIRLEFSEPDGVADSFYLALYQAALSTKTTPAITDAPTTTTPYEGNFIRNPQLISNDIMIALDTSGTAENFEKLKALALSFVAELNIVSDMDGSKLDAGTRISLRSLNGFAGFEPGYFPDWAGTSDTVQLMMGAITAFGQDKSFYAPIDKYLTAGFADNKRANTGRFLILFSSTGPSENAPGNFGPKIDFTTYGVHPILVQANMKADDKAYFTDDYFAPEKYNTWSIYNYDENKDNLKELIDKYLLSADTNTCTDLKPLGLKDNTLVFEKDSKDPQTVNIPPYYKGATAADAPWNPTVNHYCNFQSTTVLVQTKLTAGEDDVPKCYTVYYELETESDYVRIYEADANFKKGKEVVSLTGSDISGAKFTISSSNSVIEFSSDEKGVYDGFYASIENGACPTS